MLRLLILLSVIFLLPNCNSADKKTEKADTTNLNATENANKENKAGSQKGIAGVWTANSGSEPKKENIRFEFKKNGTMNFYFDELKSSFTYSVADDRSKISVFEITGREEPIKIIHWGDDELKTAMNAFGFHGNVTLKRVK